MTMATHGKLGVLEGGGEKRPRTSNLAKTLQNPDNQKKNRKKTEYFSG